MTTIAILGAGYAGLRAVKQLLQAKVNAQIVLVNEHFYHYESTQLHEVAAGTKKPTDILFDICEVVPDQVDVIIDTVDRIDRAAQRVQLQSGKSLGYDYLVNALGFESETFGIAGAEENSLSFNNLDSAVTVRNHIEQALAHYAVSQDPRDLSIVVCGAGFTGIELLGELAYRVPKLIKRYHLPPNSIRIDCIEASPNILPMLPEHLADWAVNYLTAHGIALHKGLAITEVKPGVVVAGEQAFPASTIIWTTGVRGSHVIADSGYEQKRNRVVVQADLSVAGHPEEFLIGDVSAVPDPSSGRLYPTTAQIAVAQADTAAANIAAKLAGREPSPFVFNSFGTVCSLGPHTGVALIDMMGHWQKLKGRSVGLVKRIINERSAFEIAHLKEMLADD